MPHRDSAFTAEIVGTFVDAVYAIAITLLALELPRQLGDNFSWWEIAGTIGEYAIAFAILFGFWIHNRRINAYVERYDRVLLAATALSLMLVCLIPTATALVFNYGADVTASEIEDVLFHEQGWTRAEFVDVFFVSVVVLADAGLLLVSYLGLRRSENDSALSAHRRKLSASGFLVAVAALSFLLPIENRYFMLAMPAALFFEEELALLTRRMTGRA